MVKNVNRTARLKWKVDTIKNCIYLQCTHWRRRQNFTLFDPYPQYTYYTIYIYRCDVWIGMKVLGADSFILGTRKLWRIFPINQKYHKITNRNNLVRLGIQVTEFLDLLFESTLILVLNTETKTELINQK